MAKTGIYLKKVLTDQQSTEINLNKTWDVIALILKQRILLVFCIAYYSTTNLFSLNTREHGKDIKLRIQTLKISKRMK